MLAGLVLFLVARFSDLEQKAALDKLSTYQIPPDQQK